MNKYETIANEVVKNIGGTENIESVTNCMTRLRFTLKNVSKVDVESLEKVKGVQGVVNKNGHELARGLSNYSSEELDMIKGAKTSEIENLLGHKHFDEVIHRDDLVIL